MNAISTEPIARVVEGQRFRAETTAILHGKRVYRAELVVAGSIEVL